MELPDNILIVGLGKTGVALARFLSGMGRKIAITDAKNPEALALPLKELEGISYAGFFGGHDRDVFLSAPMIIVSPGVDTQMPLLGEAREKGIKVIGEMELAARFCEKPIIAITGTNGKTTTTTLLGDIFGRAFPHVFVGGNIGNPFINYGLEKNDAVYCILEVSSFQLETIETFHPNTAVLLNITEDHLDRYRSYGEYIEAKQRIFENQTPEDYAIIRKGQSVPEGMKAQKLYFDPYDEVKEGAFFRDGIMHVRLRGEEFLYKRALSSLAGIHNTENLLAALLTAHIYNIAPDKIEEALKVFKGLPHRVEPVRELGGIAFYNDSKATNVDAAKRALEGMDSPVILIAGGKDKGGSYQAIAGLMKNVKAMILIGEAKERIASELCGYSTIYMETDLEGAVERALAIAEKGDAVLFSPMCSSFDMFHDYKERGNTFKRIVDSL
ncbi:MAG: UDP-N-acetylmuramoyl-L-alanine--D-glutamate ligase [Syntrophus sp. (in: bacteria)]|nr:UDP-N-acetylmuramoyl-L-alanine--D-glutamate ligase [Syntrophus sp. (in: bacteria)]